MENKDIIHFLVGNRIPRDFFVTAGTGESDLTIHAGSYHLALKNAGIEMCNIMTYSSILPGIATEIPHPKELLHGSVMESILSVCNVKQGQRGTAGIVYGWINERKTKKLYGGLVCEIVGDYSSEELKQKLQLSLDELYFNGYSERFEFKSTHFLIESIIPKKNYGTALVALCFVNYEYPILRGEFNGESKLQSNGN